MMVYGIGPIVIINDPPTPVMECDKCRRSGLGEERDRGGPGHLTIWLSRSCKERPAIFRDDNLDSRERRETWIGERRERPGEERGESSLHFVIKFIYQSCVMMLWNNQENECWIYIESYFRYICISQHIFIFIRLHCWPLLSILNEIPKTFNDSKTFP